MRFTFAKDLGHDMLNIINIFTYILIKIGLVVAGPIPAPLLGINTMIFPL